MSQNNLKLNQELEFETLLKTIGEISSILDEASSSTSGADEIASKLIIQNIREIFKANGIDSLVASSPNQSENNTSNRTDESKLKYEPNLTENKDENPVKLIKRSTSPEQSQDSQEMIPDAEIAKGKSVLVKKQKSQNGHPEGPPKKKLKPVSSSFIPRSRRLEDNGQPKSAYTYFYELCKEAVKNQYPGAKVYIDVTQLSRQCIARWKAMTEREKRSFRLLAKRDQDRYDERMRAPAMEEESTHQHEESIQENEETLSMDTPTNSNGNGSEHGSSRKSVAYSHEELQSILDYVCQAKKYRETGPLRMWIEAKEAGYFEGRTAIAIQQQFRKTIYPNLDKFICSKENRRLLKQAKIENSRKGFLNLSSTRKSRKNSNMGPEEGVVKDQ